MFKSPYRGGVQRVDEGCQTVESSFEGFTPASTPRLMSEESEALRYEMSSPESALLPRDTDFGYEVIDKPDEGQEGDDEDASSVSIADHYRGTPPLKGKKKKPHHKPGGRSESVSETPPPLPPKKRDSQPDREASVDSTASSIQSRPLPTPPTPRILRNPPIEDTDNDLDEAEQFHSLRSTATLNPADAAQEPTSEKF